jgi:hypothetical protein
MDSSHIVALIIFRYDGAELYAEVFDPETSHNNLISQLLAGFNMLSQEISGEALDNVPLGNNYFVFSESLHKIVFVAITKKNIRPDSFLMIVSRRFIKTFRSDLKKWTGEVTKFEEFSAVLKEIIDKPRKEVVYKVPIRPLDSIALLEFEKKYHSLIKDIIKVGTVNHNEINQKYSNQFDVEEFITNLTNQGYVGKKLNNNQIEYFKIKS